MMILGVGTDLCNVDRIQHSIDRFGTRFIARLFTPTEIKRAEARPRGRAAIYAKRFAAKEACAKALGTGFRQGVFFRDIGVTNLEDGRPTLDLTGGAGKRLADLTPGGMIADIHLSLTDDLPWAQAFVIITARMP